MAGENFISAVWICGVSVAALEYEKRCFSEGKTFMRNWRGKIVTLLVFYFAGFATAIYTLAPATEKVDQSVTKKVSVNSSRPATEASSKSQQFAIVFKEQMHKAIDLAKEKSVEIGQMLKDEIIERQQQIANNDNP